MNNKRVVIPAVFFLGILGTATTWHFSSQQSGDRNLSDEALLALIKNDQKAFESVITAGVDIHASLPEIDGKVYSIAEGLSYFERTSFMQHLHGKKIPFIKQTKVGEFDILSLSISKNNSDLLSQLALENPDYSVSYGKKGWSLMHIASSLCAHKLTPILQDKGGLKHDQRAKDGSTPLTLAAENDCLPMLSYWKEQKVDFNKKDGRGLSALSILKKKKDAALVAFVDSFDTSRKPVSVVSFYKKRKIPKDQIIDHSALIEPEERPMEATETAEYSEFAD